MMDNHRVRLEINFSSLADAESGILVEDILDYLMRDETITANENQEILSGRTSKDRAECLLHTLLGKDAKAYELFRDALEVNYPHFVDILDNTPLSCADGVSIGRNWQTDNIGLPTKPPSFVGRTKVRREILAWLSDKQHKKRMYVVTGLAGIGKTALIVTACHEHKQSVPLATRPSTDRLLFRDLRSIGSVEDLAVDILMSFHQTPTSSPIRQVCNFLRICSFDLLLVLDNAEDAMTEKLKDVFLEFLTKMLQASSRVRIAITSRISIKLVSVESMELCVEPLDELDGPALVRNLVPSLHPDLARRMCSLTGYLPLGLQLLAILMQSENNPREIVGELEEAPASTLELLQGIEGIPSSSQLIPCFRSSFQRLDEHQQCAMMALSIFPASFDRRAALAMLQSTSSDEVGPKMHNRTILRALVDRSMLMLDKLSQRYSQHPLIRSFSQTMRAISALDCKFEEFDQRFCGYFIAYAENSFQMFYQSNCCGEAIQAFWKERQNILRAIQICMGPSKPELTRLLLRFTSRKGIEFLRIVLPAKLIRKVYDSLADVIQSHDQEEESMVLTCLGFFTRVVERDFKSSLEFCERANQLQQEARLGDFEKRTFCLHSLAKIYAVWGRFEEAETIARDSLKIAIQCPDEMDRLLLKGFSVEALAGVHKNDFMKSGNSEKARASNSEYDTVLKYLAIKFTEPHIFARYIHMSQAELRKLIGDCQGALESYEKALNIQDIIMVNCIDDEVVYRLIGDVKEMLEDIPGATESFLKAFEVSNKILGDSERTLVAGEKLMSLYQKQGDDEKAAWFERKVSEIKESLNPNCVERIFGHKGN